MRRRMWLAVVLAAGMLVFSGCKSNSENKYAYRDTGIEKLSAGDYQAAVESFEQAISHSNGLVGKFEKDVLKYRAEAEYGLEDYEAAAHTYGILLEVDREMPEYLNLRSICFAQMGDWEKAIEDYARGVGSGGEVAGAREALVAVGVVLEENEQTDKAMALYQQAVSEGVQSGQVYNRMGMCKMKEKAYDEAIHYFELGLQTGDEDAVADLSYNRAVAYEFIGEFDQALVMMRDYDRAYGPDNKAQREIEFLKTR